MRLLVVEDDLSMNASLRQGLTEAGYAVDTVTTGSDGLDYALASEYDLLILDMDPIHAIQKFAVIIHVTNQNIEQTTTDMIFQSLDMVGARKGVGFTGLCGHIGYINLQRRTGLDSRGDIGLDR